MIVLMGWDPRRQRTKNADEPKMRVAQGGVENIKTMAVWTERVRVGRGRRRDEANEAEENRDEGRERVVIKR